MQKNMEVEIFEKLVRCSKQLIMRSFKEVQSSINKLSRSDVINKCISKVVFFHISQSDC